MDAIEFSKALESLENGKDLLQYHNDLVSGEKNRGIEEFRRSQKDVTKFKKFYHIVKNDLGWDGEADVDEFIDALKVTLEGKTDESNTAMSELKKQINKLTRDFTRTQEELRVEREAKAELEKTNRVKTIESTLLPKLSNEFYGHEYLLKALIADQTVDIDEGGAVIFKQGDKTLDVQQGLKWLGDKYSDARKNKQSGGSGSNAQQNASINRPKYTMEQLKTMTPEQIAADVVNVNASMTALTA